MAESIESTQRKAQRAGEALLAARRELDKGAETLREVLASFQVIHPGNPISPYAPKSIRFDSEEALDTVDALEDLSAACFLIAESKGWWDDERTVPELMALMHSEISEALEEYRNGHEVTEIYLEDGKPEGVPIELADVLIRIFDMCGRHGIPIAEAVRIKMKYNQGRPHRHGGKRL